MRPSLPLRATFALVLAVAAAGCATAPRIPVSKDDDYVYPAPRPGEASRDEARQLEDAWHHVLSGKTAEAQAIYRRILSRHAALVPAEVGLAFAELRAGSLRNAAEDFAAVLNRRPDDLPSLLGAAAAAVRREDADLALELYRRAESLRADDPVVRRRLPSVKLQVTEKHVQAGRKALAAGEQNEASAEYHRALEAAPELTSLRIELADLLVDQGDVGGASDVLAADPTGDRQVLLKLGEVLALKKDYQASLEAFQRLLRKDPRDPEAQKRVTEARGALELSTMPEEFRRIPWAGQITRADLAALVAVRVTALARLKGGEPDVAVDISGSWARDYILKALSFEILPLYPNHTFQPGATVRRGDLARAVSRVLDLVRWPQAEAPAFSDMTKNNVYYDAATRAVGAGLMDLTGTGAFEPWRPVSGRDALDVVDQVARLVGP